jgi:hypothetical protein
MRGKTTICSTRLDLIESWPEARDSVSSHYRFHDRFDRVLFIRGIAIRVERVRGRERVNQGGWKLGTLGVGNATT